MAPSPLCPGPAPQPDSLTEPNPGRLLSFRAALWQEKGSRGLFPRLGQAQTRDSLPRGQASSPLATWAPHVLPDATAAGFPPKRASVAC